MILLVLHAFGGADAGYDYLQKLQANNLGPSSSTGRLAGLVNKGELYVANGDVQMNTSQMGQDPNLRIFFPAGPDGKRSTVAIEQDHRSVKQRIAVMLGFKQFRNAVITIAGIELMHRIRKGQFGLRRFGAQGRTAPAVWKAVLRA